MNAGKRPTDVPDYRKQVSLEDQRIVVLGGGSGIGRQAVHALAQLGASTAVVDQDQAAAEVVAEEVDGVAYACDAVDAVDLRRVLLATRDSFGGPITGIVDIIGGAKLAEHRELAPEDWEAQLDINLRHAINVFRLIHELPELPESIALVGSISGIRTVPKQGAYGVVKAALHMLVVTQAAELAASGTRVNGIAPGWTMTPRLLDKLGEQAWRQVGATIPRGYAADPSEIAGPLVFLMSSLSSYVNGQMIVADGGVTNAMPQPGVF